MRVLRRLTTRLIRRRFVSGKLCEKISRSLFVFLDFFDFCVLLFEVKTSKFSRCFARRYTQQTDAHHCFQKEMFQNLRIVICKTYNCAKRTKFSLSTII